MTIAEEIAQTFNKLIAMANVTALVHIAGASGAGKSTLLDQVEEKYPAVVVKDLDEIDEEAQTDAGLANKSKDDWTDDEFRKHQASRQTLLNKFIAENANNVVVLAGFHSEGAGAYAIDVSARNKFLLDVDAETAAKQAYERSQKRNKPVRTLEEMPADIEEAQADIGAIRAEGYIPKTADAILTWLEEAIHENK
jgi:predicted ATPase